MQPPGNRTNPGPRSASACTMSARRPPDRPFHVFTGNRETKFISAEPDPSNESLRRGRRPVPFSLPVAFAPGPFLPPSLQFGGGDDFPGRGRQLDGQAQAGRAANRGGEGISLTRPYPHSPESLVDKGSPRPARL